MIAVRSKILLTAFTLSACLAVSHSSVAQDCLKGDVNLDGTVNIADWRPFVDLLGTGGFLCEADNGDGQINFLDAAGIQQRLLDQQGAAFTNTVADGAGDFFWSTANLNEGAVNGPIDINLNPGESVTLYLYYSTNGPSNTDIQTGYSINVATSQSDIIKFTEASTFNHPLFGASTRWDFPRDETLDGEDGVGVGSAQTVEDDLIIGMTALSLLGSNGTGIVEAFSAFDSGYDSAAQALLCGRVQVEAIAPGTIELAAGPNGLGIANEYDLLQSAFARANISVASNILLGDINLDGSVDFLDIAPFIDVLTTGVFQAEADMDGNGVVNFLDVFQLILFFPGR